MTIGTVDRLEAALAELSREDVAALPPARRRRLQATLGSWECLCSDILHQPKTPVPLETKSVGVLAELKNGRGEH